MSTDRVHEYAHHFKNADHEYESSKQGVWLFMVTEVLMFGGLLVGYFIFKGFNHDMFVVGSKFLDWKLGALNTVVLLFSSLAMALGIYYIRVNNRKAAITWLVLTVICAMAFMGIKYIEYNHKFHLGLFPGAGFAPIISEIADPALREAVQTTPNLHLYFSFYFLLTGLHGLHVLIGASLIIWIIYRMSKGWYGPKHWTGVEGVGIFWHLVDLVWIYLFPLLYLVG